MDIQKELKKLDTEQQKLRNRYGHRFQKFYNNCINNITANDRVIRDAQKANVSQKKDLEAASNAMQSINFKY